MYAYKNRKGVLRLAESVQKSTSFMSENMIPKNFKVVKGAVSIGSGTYGNVFAGYKNRTMRNIDVVKKFKSGSKDDQEIAMNRKIFTIAPRHVARIRATTKDSVVMDIYRGGSMSDWLGKTKGINDGIMMVLILQVLATLYKIHQKNPSFRHNDLHLGNVFIDDRYVIDRGEKLHSYKIPPVGVRAIIGDFGLSGDPSPDVFPDYGIYPGNDEMYDAHLFLNALYSTYVSNKKSKLPLTHKFLEDVLKGGYSGEKNKFVRNYRLRPGTQFTYDFLMLLNHFYFSVPLLRVKRIPRKTSRSEKLKMYKLTNTNIRSWGGNYEPIPDQLYSFVLKNLGGGGAPPSPAPRRNSRLSPIIENNRSVTHPYRAWSPVYRKRSNAVQQSLKYKRSPLKKRTSLKELEKNIRAFLKNKNFTKVSVKNIRLHLEPKYKNDSSLKAKIKEIVDKKILVTPPPVKKAKVAVQRTSLADKRRISDRKAELLRNHSVRVSRLAENLMKRNETLNIVEAEELASKRISPLSNLNAERQAVKPTTEPRKVTNLPKAIAPGPKMDTKKLELRKFIQSQGIKILPTNKMPERGNTTAISPGGRLRIGKKLCMGYKKDELVAFATRAKVSTQGTKESLCDRLRTVKFIPV